MSALASGLRELGYSEFVIRGERVTLASGEAPPTKAQILAAAGTRAARKAAADAIQVKRFAAKERYIEDALSERAKDPTAPQAIKDYILAKR